MRAALLALLALLACAPATAAARNPFLPVPRPAVRTVTVETGLSLPLASYVLTQGFGPTSLSLEPAYAGYAHFHEGVDLAAPAGTPIHADAAGVVTLAGWDDGYGLAVVLDHGDGSTSLFGHQSRLAVAVGQRVARGQVLGSVGSTGNSTGPHLHWQVTVNGTLVNPLSRLGGTRTVPLDGPCVWFAQTSHRVCHGFRAYWERFGGLAVFGYPISEEFTDPDSGLTVQYFQRARFEWHPGSDPQRFDVQLGLIGVELVAARPPRWAGMEADR